MTVKEALFKLILKNEKFILRKQMRSNENFKLILNYEYDSFNIKNVFSTIYNE